MKTALVLVAIFLAGCSGGKEQLGKPVPAEEKPEVREFKAAARKFISESSVAQNAEDRYASKDDIKRFCKSAMDAYFAIPKPPSGVNDGGIMMDAQIISLSLDVGGFVRLDIKGKIDAMEKKLNSIR